MRLSQRYIAIDGVPGAGKSTLLRLLQERLDATLVCEESAENPFLGKFYSSMKEHAFQTQLFFLLSRYRQQEQLQQPDLFGRVVLSDYHFGKDRIFALLTLAEAELALYENLYALLRPQVPPPDLVIHLQADAATIRRRLQGSADPAQQRLPGDYVDLLVDAYNHYFFHYTATPLLTVNTAAVDFARQPEEVDALLAVIAECTAGSRHYSPRTGGDAHGTGTLLP